VVSLSCRESTRQGVGPAGTERAGPIHRDRDACPARGLSGDPDADRLDVGLYAVVEVKLGQMLADGVEKVLLRSESWRGKSEETGRGGAGGLAAGPLRGPGG
jgi:hypothetical protein